MKTWMWVVIGLVVLIIIVRMIIIIKNEGARSERYATCTEGTTRQFWSSPPQKCVQGQWVNT